MFVAMKDGIARVYSTDGERRALQRLSATFCRLYVVAPLCFEKRSNVPPPSESARLEFAGFALEFDRRACQ